MGRAKKRTRDETPPEAVAETSSGRLLWALGIIFLVVAVVASGALALKQLGLMGASLPGCGPESGCGAVTGSAWGRIPGLDWPVSYIGFAYFIGMLVAWCTGAMRGVPVSLRWIGRCGTVCSFGFIIVMVFMDSYCQYCIASHAANIAFWICLERSPREEGERSFSAFMSLAFTSMIVTVIVAIGQFQRQSAELIKGAVIEQEQIQQMAQAHLDVAGDTGADEGEESPPATGSGTTTNAGAGFTGRHLLGSPEAPVKVVMISDYQCPDCYRYENQIMQILEDRDDVSLSVKHFPFSTECNPYMSTNKHRVACHAAWGAEAAGILGGNDAFWGIHRWMFEQKGVINHQKLVEQVSAYGIDPIRFDQVMRSEDVKTLILEDIEEAKDLGIFFTPMIFINGVELKWYAIPSSLAATINQIAAAIATGASDGALLEPPSAQEKYVLDWQDATLRTIPEAEHAASAGPADAPIDVDVWVEYNSDYLGKMETELDRMRRIYPDLRTTYRVYPVNSDCNRKVSRGARQLPYACMTAKAAKAAYQAGGDDGGWRYHRWLLENGTSIMGEQDLMNGAISIGLDPVLFQEALESPEVGVWVDEDVELGSRMRFRGPPAMFVNGRHVARIKLEGHDILGAVFEIAKNEGKSQRP